MQETEDERIAGEKVGTVDMTSTLEHLGPNMWRAGYVELNIFCLGHTKEQAQAMVNDVTATYLAHVHPDRLKERQGEVVARVHDAPRPKLIIPMGVARN